MTRFRRILSGLHSLTVPAASPPQPTPDYDPVYFNSEFILFIGLVIIVVFLLCLIGLNAASRCTWIRCFSQTEVVAASASNRFDHFSLPVAKPLRNIPKVTYCAETMAEKFSDDCATIRCNICDDEPYEFKVGATPGRERKRDFVDNPNGLFSAQAIPKPPPAMYSVVDGMKVGGKRKGTS
ncbi:peptidyl-prolyl cis-trans isomerase FKBP18, chloroplastic isoform X2 [Tanacetum coccineum]